MNNTTENTSITPNRLYSLKNNKCSIPRKLIENIIINNKYSTTIRVYGINYDLKSYRRTSIQMYIHYLYINRVNRIFGRRSKVSMDTYDRSFKCKKFDIMQNRESPVIFFPDKHTLCIILSSKLDGFIGMRTPDSDSTSCCVEITFVGENAKKYMRNIKTIMVGDKEDSGKQKSFIEAFRPFKRVTDDVTKFNTVTIHLKNISDIIMHESSKNIIIDNIKKFTTSASIYNQYSIHRRIGFLLYGKPGTGKSSLIAAIIRELIQEVRDFNNLQNEDDNSYRVYTYTLDVASTPLDLDSSINGIYEQVSTIIDDSPCDGVYVVIIIEEIDSVIFSSRDKDMSDGAIKQKVLLEFIDGMKTPNANYIFLATTNYYDNLDPALIRDGRFDVKVELPYFDQQQMTEMCEHFGVNKKEVFEYNNCSSSYYDDNYEICPTTLQNMILSYKIGKELEETKDVNA